jgi:hypothetical protein
VVEAFINYIAHSPSDVLSPLFLELNTSAMLTAMGDASGKVTIYDNNAQAADTPYVKLSDEGSREMKTKFTNGGSYWEKQLVTCECVALGETPLSAANRAELLKLAIEGFAKKLRIDLSIFATRTDLGGTASTETIGLIDIANVTQEKPLTVAKDGKSVATRTALIELWVFKERRG